MNNNNAELVKQMEHIQNQRSDIQALIEKEEEEKR